MTKSEYEKRLDKELVANIASRLYSGNYSGEKRSAAIHEAARIVRDTGIIIEDSTNESQEDK